ncbi:MafI family immunity protein [Micromonospora sp. STR1s_6]|uniref:MafI family immunity protein n=1 Tax=Micromonospora tarensis TaxID=2806100 RepID=A0ABS1YJ34_9ACTN|nr:MafI family immunity protein [Micromonospora tarensis]
MSQLLEESPLTSAEVIDDVRHLMSLGEEELAFDTMCSWIYEDALPITSAYYARLVSAAEELGTPRSTDRLDELVEGRSGGVEDEPLRP